MTWARGVPTGIPSLPWALVDLKGRPFVFSEDIQVTVAMREVLNRALYRMLEIDGDTNPALVGCGLTLANGELTDAGRDWIAYTELPAPQPPN